MSIQLDIKIVECVFNSYPRCRKGYEQLGVGPGGLKFTNPICINFSDFHHRKKSKDMGMKILENMAEKTQFEVEVPTIDTSNNEGMITKTFAYHFIHDKVGKKIIPSQKGGYAGLGCYTLNVVEQLRNFETKTFREVLKSRWSQIWLKNHT